MDQPDSYTEKEASLWPLGSNGKQENKDVTLENLGESGRTMIKPDYHSGEADNLETGCWSWFLSSGCWWDWWPTGEQDEEQETKTLPRGGLLCAQSNLDSVRVRRATENRPVLDYDSPNHYYQLWPKLTILILKLVEKKNGLIYIFIE